MDFFSAFSAFAMPHMLDDHGLFFLIFHPFLISRVRRSCIHTSFFLLGARNPSPQGPAHHRPSKRMRSPVSPARHADPPSFSQPLPPQWAAHSDAKKTRHDVGGVRDKPPHISEPPILIPSAKYMEREEGQRHELQKGHDIKRQKTTVDLDSASTRRRPAPDEINSRDIRENGVFLPSRVPANVD